MVPRPTQLERELVQVKTRLERELAKVNARLSTSTRRVTELEQENGSLQEEVSVHNCPFLECTPDPVS